VRIIGVQYPHRHVAHIGTNIYLLTVNLVRALRQILHRTSSYLEHALSFRTRYLFDMRSLLIIFFALPLLFFLVTPTTHADDTSRSITIMNESGRRAAIYWINPDDGELLLQSDPDILHGASFDLDSYVGHNFEVRELPKKSTNECSAGEAKACGVDYFTVTENHDQGEFTLSPSVFLIF